ncbi:MAG: hypothetical protein IJM09_06320 [Neisseriaceae bacterium]|nr:hypothetical protein [Neisseriaceae bacterium]
MVKGGITFRQPETHIVIASRQTGVSSFTAYGCVVARVSSTRGNPKHGEAIPEYFCTAKIFG